MDPRAWLRSVRPDRQTLGRDAVAGIPSAIGSVPDGMASAVLVGVNPVYGLYASVAGPIGGGLTASTRLMVITTTTAAALAAGSALDPLRGSDRSDALFVLSLLAGAFMIAAGVLRLGRYTRFVSVSVMTGFLTGVATNIVCGQLADLLGADAGGPFALAKAWDVVTHPAQIDGTAAAVGLSALALIALLSRTRLSALASVVALAIPTVLTLGSSQVVRVDDVGEIPTGLPTPHLPDLSLLASLDLVIGAATVAVIVLVQGAGVAESAPNPDGSASNPDRDFMAQGVANVLSGVFRGQPVGASVGQTALSIAAGARSRWASILSGVWMIAILVLFSGIVGQVAMPTLAAVLIYAAITSLRVNRLETVWRTGLTSQVSLVTTFAATLLLPIAVAVGIGVALSLLLQLNREALDLRVVALQPDDAGRLVERPAPSALADRAVTVLDVYGSLQFAGARTLQTALPDPSGRDAPVVVLRLRGRTQLGATSSIVLTDYAARLDAAGGRLFLSGVDTDLMERMRRSGRIDPARIPMFAASPALGASSLEAFDAAQRWLRERAPASPGRDDARRAGRDQGDSENPEPHGPTRSA
jgi:SulP family sulfate permease